MEKGLNMHYHAGNREWLRGIFARTGYPGQFEPSRDPLMVAIPREEIMTEMVRCGEERTLDLVCISVAVVLEAMTRVRAA